jgi:hypothetical protein
VSQIGAFVSELCGGHRQGGMTTAVTFGLRGPETSVQASGHPGFRNLLPTIRCSASHRCLCIQWSGLEVACAQPATAADRLVSTAP